MKNGKRVKKKIDRETQTERKTAKGRGLWKNRDKDRSLL